MKPQTNTSVESQRLLTETLIAGLIATALALLVLSWLGREVVAGRSILTRRPGSRRS
jgi:hypothetical protein